MEISPFGEGNFVVSVSVGRSKKDPNFPSGHVMPLINLVKFSELVVARVGDVGKFLGNGLRGFLLQVVFGSQAGFLDPGFSC